MLHLRPSSKNDFARQIPSISNTHLLSRHSGLSILQDLCNGRTGLAALQPSVEVREVRLKVEPVSEKEHNGIPRHERRIRIAELAADEEFLVLQDAVEDAGDATNLIDVALNSFSGW